MTNVVCFTDRRRVKSESIHDQEFRLVPIDLTNIRAALIAISSDSDYKDFKNQTGLSIASIDLFEDENNHEIPIDSLVSGVLDSDHSWNSYFRYLFELYGDRIDPLNFMLQNPFD